MLSTSIPPFVSHANAASQRLVALLRRAVSPFQTIGTKIPSIALSIPWYVSIVICMTRNLVADSLCPSRAWASFNHPGRARRYRCLATRACGRPPRSRPGPPWATWAEAFNGPLQSGYEDGTGICGPITCTHLLRSILQFLGSLQPKLSRLLFNPYSRCRYVHICYTARSAHRPACKFLILGTSMNAVLSPMSFPSPAPDS